MKNNKLNTMMAFLPFVFFILAIAIGLELPIDSSIVSTSQCIPSMSKCTLDEGN